MPDQLWKYVARSEGSFMRCTCQVLGTHSPCHQHPADVPELFTCHISDHALFSHCSCSLVSIAGSRTTAICMRTASIDMVSA